MEYRYGRKWDTSCGSPRATFPPSTQTETNYSPKSQNIPPVKKIPAKIEFPPIDFRRIFFAQMGDAGIPACALRC